MCGSFVAHRFSCCFKFLLLLLLFGFNLTILTVYNIVDDNFIEKKFGFIIFFFGERKEKRKASKQTKQQRSNIIILQKICSFRIVIILFLVPDVKYLPSCWNRQNTIQPQRELKKKKKKYPQKCYIECKSINDDNPTKPTDLFNVHLIFAVVNVFCSFHIY